MAWRQDHTSYAPCPLAHGDSVRVLFHAALLPEATDEVVPSADSEYTTPQLPLSMTEPQTGGAAVETSASDEQ